MWWRTSPADPQPFPIRLQNSSLATEFCNELVRVGAGQRSMAQSNANGPRAMCRRAAHRPIRMVGSRAGGLSSRNRGRNALDSNTKRQPP